MRDSSDDIDEVLREESKGASPNAPVVEVPLPRRCSSINPRFASIRCYRSEGHGGNHSGIAPGGNVNFNWSQKDGTLGL